MEVIMAISEDHQFNIYNKILDYTIYLNQYIVSNIPNVHRDLRIHLLDETHFLAKNMFYAIYNKGNIRMKYLTDIQVNISILDMLTTELKHYKCISSQKITSSISKLSEIKNIIYAWKLNEEKKKN